ncbi:hypothetical protein KPA07_06355 [Corynebacterium aurimucosum]|uniref:hypothetical protein n=1 Tax=Corynebacterium aurimucosum TaxID=169292 RepID=UPI001C0EA53E|nr:hypothetical protein [Corynebacterium aurimucosum]MBU5654534.1 hypothetical protein [Corynebacterium aurimucosum]
MAANNPQATGDFVMQALADRADQTSALKRYKGTVMTVVAWVLAIAAIVADSGLHLPDWAATSLVVVLGTANALGIRYYKPEATRAQQDMVRSTIAHQIDHAHGISPQ